MPRSSTVLDPSSCGWTIGGNNRRSSLVGDLFLLRLQTDAAGMPVPAFAAAEALPRVFVQYFKSI